MIHIVNIKLAWSTYFRSVLTCAIFIALLPACSGQTKETVLDRITHIEDSIHYRVPRLPRLCESTDARTVSVDIGDCILHVEIEGEGLPMVLINGGPGGTHHYFHPWFSKMAPRHKLIYYDQRGTGESDFESGEGYSFLQAVNDLDRLREELGIEKWVVFGYSYGGGIAQVYSLLYPERTSAMVLVNTLPLLETAVFNGDQEKYLSERELERRSAIIRLFVDGELTMAAFLYNLTLNGDWKRQNFCKPAYEEMVRSALYEWVNDEDFNSIVSQSYRDYALDGAFVHCPIPTLVFEGANDLTWGPQKSLSIKENHPNSTFILVDDAAHPIFKEAEEIFFAQLLDFTTGLRPVSQAELDEWLLPLQEKLQQFRN